MPRPSKGPHLYFRRRKGRNAVWVIRDGEHEQRTGCGEGDRLGAEEALNRYRARRFRPNYAERDPGRLRIVDILTMYGRVHAPNHAAPELVGYHMVHLLRFWGDKTLIEVRGQSCREYVTWRTRQKWQGRSISVGTARRELETLQAAINKWHEESPLEAVPKLTLPPMAPARQRFLTRNEAAALLRAARRLRLAHIARFILIGIYTGTRHAAILSLRWLPSPDAGWLDLEKGVLHRRGSAERETNKRRTPARIPDRLMAHLRRWRAMDGNAGIVGVITWQGAQLAKERRAWARAVKGAGLDEGVTPHVLRHTCATWALNTDTSFWDVAALLGTSVSMIERTYGHHSPDFQKGVSGAFSGARRRGRHG